jgi:LPXTG-motif cell wall-anchored protein
VNLSIRRFTVLAIALLTVLAMSATAAFAQYPPARGLDLACERSGNQIVCVLSGAEANDQCPATLTQRGRVVDESSQTTDNDGRARYTLTARDSSAARVDVNCVRSGSTADTVPAAQARAGAGTPVARAGTLPMTGTSISVLLLAGAALVGGGVVAARRRSSVDA